MRLVRTCSTSRRLLELIGNLRELNNARRSQTCVELAEAQWISPISVLPIAVYANHNRIGINCLEEDRSINSYLGTIYFPYGTDELSELEKSYLPITTLSCSDKNDCVLNEYEARILNNLPEKERQPFINSLKLLTSELVANIREHAKVDDYWILAQYWDRTRTCEIAMCDTGIGYKESYQGTSFEVEQHIDALRNALQGKSSKDPEERGAGIPTIVRMFVQGYGGEVMIMSGDSLLYVRQRQSTPYRFDLEWQGSFVGIRFKLKAINFYEYLR